jgi:hypothetical protein
MTYDIAESRALADKVRIELLDRAEMLECIFTLKDADETELSDMRFVESAGCSQSTESAPEAQDS